MKERQTSRKNDIIKLQKRKHEQKEQQKKDIQKQ